MNQATRDKLSKSLTGRKLSKSHIANMAKALTGRKLSDETKAKMSAAHQLRHLKKRQQAQDAITLGKSHHDN